MVYGVGLSPVTATSSHIGHDPLKHNLALNAEELCTAPTAYEHIQSI